MFYKTLRILYLICTVRPKIYSGLKLAISHPKIRTKIESPDR